MRVNRFIAAFFVGLLGLASCGGGQSLDLSPEGAEGRRIANAVGCGACHGRNGQGGIAPTWRGVYQNRVELEGGLSVVATEAYLYRSIIDPQAEIVRGFTTKMPVVKVDDDQIAAIIAYIKELQ